ncbi:uncharacterized protein LOC135813565 [Sycon ciliatum]|uniref:uncharacterized protein LOC135813565 n=1 Tax=Sycon ciliatum TaxID=27933 RepID=UPI0020A858C0|eukprot:scpid30694/ scgid13833/ 
MADIFSVEIEPKVGKADLLMGAESCYEDDRPDGLIDPIEKWIHEQRLKFGEVFKNAKAVVATAVLELFEQYHGQEGANASKDLLLAGGPKSKFSRIAIIGGGPAGVHMAYTLSQAGFKNLTIFEKTDRVGGKSCSFTQEDGMVQEMGTCYLSPDYAEIKQLLAKYECDDQARVIGRTVWDADKPAPQGVDFQQWLNAEIAKACKSNHLVALRLLQECVHYIRNHHRLFGRYEGFLMAEPSAETLKELNCSIDDYLTEIDCNSLKPIFKLAYTMQGYGYIEHTPALYGLLWVTPKLLVGLVEQLKVRSQLPDKHCEAGTHERSITILKAGWGKLWESIVRDESLGIECRMNVDIAKPIVRDENGVSITYHTRRRVQDGTTMTALATEEKFDFLVVAAPMQNILPLLDDKEDEQRLFSGLRAATFVTTLCNYLPPKKNTEKAVDSWLGNVSIERPPFSVWTSRDSHHVRHKDGQLEPIKRPELHASMVVYQYADLDSAVVDAEAEASRAFKQHYAQHIPGGSPLEIVRIEKRTVWPYFPRHSQSALCDGILWRLLKRQGEYSTWYTGAATCFESVNAITNYNQMLVNAWAEQLEASKAAAAVPSGPLPARVSSV